MQRTVSIPIGPGRVGLLSPTVREIRRSSSRAPDLEKVKVLTIMSIERAIAIGMHPEEIARMINAMVDIKHFRVGRLPNVASVNHFLSQMSQTLAFATDADLLQENEWEVRAAAH